MLKLQQIHEIVASLNDQSRDCEESLYISCLGISKAYKWFIRLLSVNQRI